MPTEIVLVRHARSVPPTADGPDDFTRPLTRDGLRQAHELVPALTEPRPAAVWSSPYRRAIQTVQPTADALGLPVRTRTELREWDDGLAFTEVWERHYVRSWTDLCYARPGGESLDQLSIRAVEAVRALARHHAGRVVLVGSHGTFICRALAGFGVPVSWATVRQMPMPALYRLRFTDPSTSPEMFERS
ncbi:histidine phosphatase family protein [Micromonospora sediminimaris]|uniref:Phosphoglycerate mutase n=1 Tax=Micromonospora sediminimaris TaxID=547162 RepID=A0A9W5XL29_9ACTN|nr:histidine phosphatase family protein [Micromonospora sediminimaris]GIJ34549.1 phosphoglycerate mutase [Micromonospora sediminimaris]SFD40302.1 2,3-bisphosphoglycerate-dependent phosphoglycerate mutase [Micromonospora sediminimaris]